MGRRLTAPLGLRVLAAIGLLAFGSTALAQSFTIGANFQGSSLGPLSNFIPPDTMGAIGPNHFVELINGRFRVYDRVGTPLQSKTLDSFWLTSGVVPSTAFDPRVLYDASTDRWLAVSVDSRATAASSYLVAASNTGDPTGPWTAHRIDADTSNSTWADFPTLGLGSTGVYIGSNNFTNANSFHSVSLVVIPKADLLAGSVAGVTKFERFSVLEHGFAIQPVVDVDNSGPAGLHPVLATYLSTPGALAGSRIDVTNVYTPSRIVATPMPTVPRTNPPTADQPGPKANLNTLDLRFSGNAVLVDGNIWGTRAFNESGRSAVEVFRVDALTNAILESQVISDPSLAYYYPSIAVNTFGDVVVGFSGSDANTFVSSFAVAGIFDGLTTTFGTPQLLKAGVSDYLRLDSSNRNRWGDYSATMVDPTNPKHFWTIQEFVSATDFWSTQITELIVPEPSTAFMAGFGLLALVLIARNGSRRAPS